MAAGGKARKGERVSDEKAEEHQQDLKTVGSSSEKETPIISKRMFPEPQNENWKLLEKWLDGILIEGNPANMPRTTKVGSSIIELICGEEGEQGKRDGEEEEQGKTYGEEGEKGKKDGEKGEQKVEYDAQSEEKASTSASNTNENKVRVRGGYKTVHHKLDDMQIQIQNGYKT